MNRHMGSVLACLCFAACLRLSAHADFLVHTNVDNTVTIVGFTGSVSSVNIPAQLEGRDVVAVGAGAFSNALHITQVQFPDSVVNIYTQAFFGCASLQSVTFGSGLESIEPGAFEGCDVRELYLPNSLTILGPRAFAANSNMTHFSTGHGLSHVPRSAIEVAALHTVEIGDGVTHLGGFDNFLYPGTGPLTFAGGSNLVNVSLGIGMTNLDSGTFSDCASLEQVNIPDAVEVIGRDAFRRTRSLTHLTIGEGVTRIESSAFQESGIQEVHMGSAVGDIGSWAFERTAALTTFTFGGALTNIGLGAFVNAGITNAALPDSLVHIGVEAFNGATSLVRVAVGSGVASIGRGAFYRTRGLESFEVHPDNAHYKSEDGHLMSKSGDVLIQVALGAGHTNMVIPPAVETVAYGAAAFHPTLAAVTFPGSVRVIEDWSFPAVSSLRQIIFEEGVESVGSYAFAWTGVEEVNVPMTITNIGNQAFYRTAMNTNFNVNADNPAFSSPGGVLFNKDQTVLVQYPPGRAGDYAVPEGATLIASRAFEGASQLTGVSIPGTVNEIGRSAFLDCSSLSVVINSNGLARIGSSAFRNCYNLTSITIPASVSQIDSRAFEQCTRLQSVLFLGDAPALENSTSFDNSPYATLYRLTEASGWPDAGDPWGNRPTETGLPPIEKGSMRIDTEGVVFNLGWANSPDFVVEAATDLKAPVWEAMQTNSGNVASNQFIDGLAMHSQRVYRVRLR